MISCYTCLLLSLLLCWPDLVSSFSASVASPPPLVQRVYETYHWTYTKDKLIPPETYCINYRCVQEQDGGSRQQQNGSAHGCPPILLVHGFGANCNHFRHQFPALVEAGYRVYAIDLLGFGASDKPMHAATLGFSIELFVQLLCDFVTDISANDEITDPWTLAGNSIGGLCCLGVAAQQAQSQTDIASIVLFNTSGGMTGFRYEYVPFWARPIMSFVQNVVLGPALGGYFFRNFKTRKNVETILKESGVYGDTANVDEELLEIMLAPADDKGAEQVFLAVFGGPAGPKPESFLPHVTVPVLALWGECDPWTPVRPELVPYHGNGQFTLKVLPGAGHCPHDECPDRCNEEMIAFMQQVAVAASDDATRVK